MYEMQVKEEVTSKTVDTVIENSHWARQFRQYLTSRRLEDDVTILRLLTTEGYCAGLSSSLLQISCSGSSSQDRHQPE